MFFTIEAKSISASSSSLLCAVTTRKPVATFLLVTGIPAYASPAIAEVTPGITSNSTPLSLR